MKKQIIFLLFFLSPSLGKTQSTPLSNDGRSFREVKLLDSYDSVLTTIKKDPLLLLNPLSDFEDFEDSSPNWLVAKMPPLMNQVYYHFYQKKLYVITLFFNAKRTSYSQIYEKLKKNYGPCTSMNASQASWEINGNTTIVLDNLPSLKYIDTNIFNILKENSGTKTPLQTLQEQERELESKILDNL